MKPIERYPRYSICERGHIYRGTKILPRIDNGRTLMCRVVDRKGVSRCVTISRILWETYIGELLRQHKVGYKDGDYKNLSITNLQLVY